MESHAILNVAMPAEDPCCGEPLNAAMLAGLLDSATTWECPACGCEWRCETKWNVRLWRPFEWAQLIPSPRR